jgi:glycerol-3-phosphate O-acyltransferase
MFSYKKIRVRFLRSLERLIYFWVKSRVIPKSPKSNLPLSDPRSICYVLKQKSLLDLLVLDYHCAREGLPRPLAVKDENEEIKASVVYMKKQSVTAEDLSLKDCEELEKLLEREQKKDSHTQLIPVSTFWGRNPGPGEKSLMRLLFFDEERGSFIARVFTFFVHGRNVFSCLGKPIFLSQILEEDKDATLEKKSRDLHKQLSTHFYEKQISVLGPSVYNRTQVMHTILHSDSVKEAISREEKTKKIREEKARKRAFKYIDEIAAQASHNILRFFEIVLKWVFKRIYKKVHIYHFEPVRELAEQHEIIYLPCHRSHMDYLVLNYHLLRLGVTVPHTAAGINMNFWPMGRIFRGGGSFFLRRSFNGNALYKAVFEEYLHYLIKNRHSLCFYLEGGRSRTGHLLEPKLGLLSMVTRYAHNTDKKIYLVPVNISYDKMQDGLSYIKELRGYKKENESFGQLFKARKVLQQQSGCAYINFGEPIDLQKELTHEDHLKLETKALGKKIMEKIAEASVVSPISLVSLALLSAPSRALPEEELTKLITKWCELLKALPYSSYIKIPEADFKSELRENTFGGFIARFSHSAGDVVYIEEKKVELMSYYKNTILPLFLVPSLIASAFEAYTSLTEENLKKTCSTLYRLLAKEFFLQWTEDEAPQIISKYLEVLTQLGFLTLNKETNEFEQAEVLTEEHFELILLGRVIGPKLKLYCLFILLLDSEHEALPLKLENYEKDCSLLAQKLTILAMLPEKGIFTPKWFAQFIELLTESKLIEKKESGIIPTQRLLPIQEAALAYLGPHLSASVTKTKGLRKSLTQTEKA